MKGREFPHIHSIHIGSSFDEELSNLKVAIGAGIMERHQTTVHKEGETKSPLHKYSVHSIIKNP